MTEFNDLKLNPKHKYVPPPANRSEKFNISLKLDEISDLNESLKFSKDNKLDFLVSPFSAVCDENGINFNLLNSIKSPENLNLIIGENLNPETEEVDLMNEIGQQIVQQLHCSYYLNVPQVYVKLVRDDNNNFVNYLREYERKTLIIVSMDKTEGETSNWHKWQNFYINFDHKENVKIALELTANSIPDEEIQEILRWKGEPIDTLVIDIKSFVKDKSGNLSLSKNVENLIKLFNVSKKLNFLISGSKCNLDINFKDYISHIKNLVASIQPLNDWQPDWIGRPPNLYDIYQNQDIGEFAFIENDETKYQKYQLAIEEALKDKIQDSELSTKSINLLTLGAGTRKLVETVLKAIDNTKRKVKVMIVEDVPQIIFTLEVLLKTLWKNKNLKLIPKSQVDLELPEKVDIVVSDFNGSFGDNAISPESLVNLKRYFNPGGISIPNSTVSYVQPIMSATANNVLKQQGELKNGYKKWMWDIYHVSNLTTIYEIDEPKEVFRFDYPDNEDDRNRYRVINFKSKIDCVLDGFLGYFEANLYKDIKISNLPNSDHKLSSLPPVYFPVEIPQIADAGGEISLSFWRTMSYNMIYYEWQTSKPKLSKIHNRKGVIQHVEL